MIKADKKKAFQKLFHFYNRFLISRSFHHISISKNSWVPTTNHGIYLMNHSSWWDSLILFYLNQEKLKLDGIAMMAEEGLQRFPFFRKIGAFSVDPTSRRSLLESLNYASDQLQHDKHLFLFPQGEESHLEKRPFTFFSGAAYLQEKVPSTPVIPIVFYHGLFHHQLPEWYIHIGQPMTFPEGANRKEKTFIFEQNVEDELNQLKQMVMSDQPDQFLVLLRGKQGIGQRWENMKKRWKRED
ncbi:lysophospholipid acyltransferase family protein [Salipaludibacillus daqingensis]|uniref:lysophospholipid acyltransferase family protein n=1 Tax=Salipaludibacillus daqingensis TaxID=3041001 RepID=UPI002476419F|nr:lysophospholipid acyltransferase family protein [Salipaludibacillus daqingensis]